MSKKITNIHTPPLQNKVEIKRYPNGEILSKTPYVNGKKHGMEIEYHKSGEKWQEKMWVNYTKYGMNTWWYDRGSKGAQTMWLSDKAHGVHTSWDEERMKTTERYYLRGREYGRIEWGAKGNVIRAKFLTPGPTANSKSSETAKSRKTK